MMVRVGSDEQDVLLSEPDQAEIPSCWLTRVDDVEAGPLVLRGQVVQPDVSLDHHPGYVVQVDRQVVSGV